MTRRRIGQKVGFPRCAGMLEVVPGGSCHVMGLFDTVICEYPLPIRAHQRLEFQTKDLDCALLHYTITRLGRLVRHPGRLLHGSSAPEGDVEWPYHGVLNIYATDPERQKSLVEYVVYMSYGGVDAIRPATEGVEADPPSRRLGISPWGRPLTVRDLERGLPEKVELIEGQIPGAEALALLLMTQLGWDRVIALARYVGRETRAPVTTGEVADDRAPELDLLANLRLRRAELEALLSRCSDHWGYEDPVYRFYHQSFKVYDLQRATGRIVDELGRLAPGRPLDPRFLEIVAAGTGQRFSLDHNARWSEVTRPIVEAFLHARYFLEMAVRHAHLEAPPDPLPSGYAALLVLYGLR